jgi:hypothetical protein
VLAVVAFFAGGVVVGGLLTPALSAVVLTKERHLFRYFKER